MITAIEEEYGKPLLRAPVPEIERPGMDRLGHIGVHDQTEAGKKYLGVHVPVGRLEGDQMRVLADVAERFGSGDIRFTVWQNVLIPDVPEDKVVDAIALLKTADLDVEASVFSAGGVARTGNAGCKFAGADTKQSLLDIIARLESKYELAEPLNIHVTGCHHSCAQHYVGDIGLQGATVGDGEEGYIIVVGGGVDDERGIAHSALRWPCPRLLMRLIIWSPPLISATMANALLNLFDVMNSISLKPSLVSLPQPKHLTDLSA